VRTVPFQPLEPALYREIVRRALAEDLGWGDVTTEATVPSELRARGIILAKSPCVIAGLEVAAEVFTQLDPGCTFERRRKDSDACQPGDIVAEVHGGAAAMLTAERTALNFLCHLSGVASLTRRFVRAAAAANPKCRMWDTRKTTPGLRALEKAAVRAGGGVNHRGSLSDFVLVKDNHLAGLSITDAVSRARERWPARAVEVECDHLEQVAEAVAAGATVVLCDNMTPDQVRQSVELAGGRTLIEVSGGITLDTVAAYAAAGADLISTSAITQSAPALDIGLDIGLDGPGGG
jgi:nicotinate-nucleotide pyrophosphorylase (carboxylating)